MGAIRRSFRIYAAMLQILCMMLVWSLLTPSAQAVPPPTTEQAESPAYQQLIDDAIREYRDRNFPEARSLFSRANEMFPNARATRGVAMAEFEMRNYAESIDQLQRALAFTVRPLEGDLRKETEALLARAESFVGRYRVEATPVLSAILVNGAARELRSGNMLVLEVGDYALEFRAPGFAPEKRSLNVKGGEQSVLAVSLSPQTVALPSEGPRTDQVPLAPAPTKPVDQKRPLRKNPWLWTGVGVVAAGAAVGLALGLKKDGGTADPIAPNPVYTAKAQ